MSWKSVSRQSSRRPVNFNDPATTSTARMLVSYFGRIQERKRAKHFPCITPCKTCGVGIVNLCSFLDLALDSREWSVPRFDLFIQGETAPSPPQGSHWIVDWVGRSTTLYDVERRKVLHLTGLELRPTSPPSPYPVAIPTALSLLQRVRAYKYLLNVINLRLQHKHWSTEK
jgi:hypothetical protein